MAFEKVFTYQYDELPDHTKYRFAEIELGKAVRTLSTLYRNNYQPRQQAVSNLFKTITPPSDIRQDQETKFLSSIASTYTQNPPKKEVIMYLIVHGHSYNKIRDLTSASYNTIAKMRITPPEFYPIYPSWNEEMLHNWNDVKHTLNLFNESLAHTNTK